MYTHYGHQLIILDLPPIRISAKAGLWTLEWTHGLDYGLIFGLGFGLKRC